MQNPWCRTSTGVSFAREWSGAVPDVCVVVSQSFGAPKLRELFDQGRKTPRYCKVIAAFFLADWHWALCLLLFTAGLFREPFVDVVYLMIDL